MWCPRMVVWDPPSKRQLCPLPAVILVPSAGVLINLSESLGEQDISAFHSWCLTELPNSLAVEQDISAFHSWCFNRAAKFACCGS